MWLHDNLDSNRVQASLLASKLVPGLAMNVSGKIIHRQMVAVDTVSN